MSDDEGILEFAEQFDRLNRLLRGTIKFNGSEPQVVLGA
jgi:hypothetical protein